MSDKFVATLQNYRWYEDGTESASTVLENENIAHDRTMDADSQVQLRVMIEETGAGSISGATTDDWTIEYRLNGAGGWTAITTATSLIKIDTGASLTDAAATTNRSTDGVSDGSGTFVAGEQVGGSGADGEVTDFQLTADNFTEFVYGFVLVYDDLADNDSLTFRIALNGSNITSTNTPTITIDRVFNPTITVPAASVTITEAQPSETVNTDISVPADSLALSVYAPSVAIGVGVAADSLAITGYAPERAYGMVITGYEVTLSEDGGGEAEAPAAGSVTISSAAPTLIFNFVKEPSVQSVVIQGLAPSLDSGIPVPADSLAISSQAPTLGKGIPVAADSLSITTYAVTLDTQIPVAADSLAFSTYAVTLGTGIPVAADSLAISSQAPTLIFNFNLTVGADGLVISGQSVDLGGDKSIPVAAGSLAISSQAVTLGYDWAALPAADSLQITGLSPQLSWTVEPASGSVSITGYAPQLSYSVRPSSDSLVITGHQPSIPTENDVVEDVAAASVSITVYAPSISVNSVITPNAGSLNITTYAPSLQFAWVADPNADSLAITTYSVTLDTAYPVAADSLALTTYAPSLKRADVLPVSADSLQTTGYAPSLILDYVVSPAADSLAITTYAASVASDTGIAVAAASLQITGYAPSLKFAYVLDVGADGLQITGNSISVLQSDFLPDVASLTISSSAPSLRIDIDYGVSITNPTATTNVPVNYQIDDRTGFKVKVKDALVKEYTGHLVRPESLDIRSEQEFVRSKRKENQRGPVRPEPVGNERFIEDEYPNGVDSEDL
jgi:hypothetical protein